MTCCQYLCKEGRPLYRAERWSVHNTTCPGQPLSSQHISELLPVLNPARQREFFRAWIERNQAREYFALDITSVSSFSELISMVKYGYTRAFAFSALSTIAVYMDMVWGTVFVFYTIKALQEEPKNAPVQSPGQFICKEYHPPKPEIRSASALMIR
ncbi:hypothetical protein [Allobaculum fili]|uniref:hypothetical protein n=1 Tax=Allobaculum fili TaxID=2834460 RepID=UPI001E304BEE|nr:hypothetical protein [Allobaculum fili]